MSAPTGFRSAHGADPADYERLLRELLRRARPLIASFPEQMNEMADFAAEELARLHPVLRPAPALAPEGDALAVAFAQEGCVGLGPLVSAGQVAAISAFLEDKPLDYYDAGDRPLGSSRGNDWPEEAFVGYFDHADLADCPHLLDIANHPLVIGLAARHLGFLPILDNIVVWRSRAGRDVVASPQILHRDKDCLRFCKLFVYLSNVDEESGPHVFLPGSHRIDRFTEHYAEALASLAKASGFRSLLSFDRFRRGRRTHRTAREAREFFRGGQRNNAERLEQIFSARFRRLLGPAGSAFLVNTYGLHKGLPPMRRDRLILQSLYTLIPYGDFLIGMKPRSASELKVTIPITPEFRYTNQLYLA